MYFRYFFFYRLSQKTPDTEPKVVRFKIYQVPDYN